MVLKTPKSLKTSSFIQVEMAGEFTDEGTETHFAIGSQPAYVRAVSSGNKRSGILHSLVVHDTEVPEFVE